MCQRQRLALVWLAIFAAQTACAPQEEQAIANLVKRFQSQLPAGWSVSYEKEDASVSIERKEPLLMLPVVPGMYIGEKPELRTFDFSFRIVPYLPLKEYRRLKVENDRLQTEAKTIFDELSRRRVPLKMDKTHKFAPTNERDKKDVERYEQLGSSMHALPQYYFRNISLRWSWPWWSDTPYAAVTDPALEQECARVYHKIIAQLSRYPER